MKISKSTRKKIGWLLAVAAVAAMVLGNFSVNSALVSILSDFGTMLLLGIGIVLIVA